MKEECSVCLCDQLVGFGSQRLIFCLPVLIEPLPCILLVLEVDVLVHMPLETRNIPTSFVRSLNRLSIHICHWRGRCVKRAY